MGALINKTTFEGGAFSKGGAHWKGVINRIVTVITVLEAILTGKQSRENIQCFFFFFLPTKISQEKLWTNVWKILRKRPDKFRHRCGPH